jgi:hypothetical protein
MNERPDAPSGPNEKQRERIDYLVDTMGISYADALALEGAAEDVPPVSRQESRRMHPSNYIPKKTLKRYEPRYDGDTFDTVDTSDLTADQLEINRVGLAGVREALRRSRQATSSPEEYNRYLLERQAAEDRQQRS